MNAKTLAFQRLIEEQLEGLPELRFRRMFGGYGLYAGELFFGIIREERIYFHTSGETQARYQTAGMGCFITPGRQRALKRYYEAPAAVIEDARELRRWAAEAIGTAAERAREA